MLSQEIFIFFVKPIPVFPSGLKTNLYPGVYSQTPKTYKGRRFIKIMVAQNTI
ncbi:MAG: hypothetical protein ACR2F2_03485 [Pyrinomonadaceae bacterium]